MFLMNIASRFSSPPPANEADLQSAHEEQNSKLLQESRVSVEADQFPRSAATHHSKEKSGWPLVDFLRSVHPVQPQEKRVEAIKSVEKLPGEVLQKQKDGNLDSALSLLMQAIAIAQVKGLQVRNICARTVGKLTHKMCDEALPLQAEGHFQPALDTAIRAAKVALDIDDKLFSIALKK